jgi:hypothetical protein
MASHETSGGAAPAMGYPVAEAVFPLYRLMVNYSRNMDPRLGAAPCPQLSPSPRQN